MPRLVASPKPTILLVAPALLMLAVAPVIAHAQSRDSVAAKQDSTDPRAAQPERPTVATHAYVVAPGYVEIETGVQDAQPSHSTQFTAPVVVKIGVGPRLQLEVQAGYSRISGGSATASGATDLAIALKQRVLGGAPILHDFSVQGTIKLPTGSANVTTRTTDASILLISSRPIGAAELDLNVGYTRRSGDGTLAPINATFGTVSFGTHIMGALGGVAELFIYPATSGPAGEGTSAGFLFGPTYQVRPWLVLDSGAILNVRNMAANAIYAGLTYNVGRIPGLPGSREDIRR